MLETHAPESIAGTLEKIKDILTDYYAEPDNRPALQYHSKEDMVAAFHSEAPPEEGMGMDAALDLVRDKVIPASAKTWHPRFLNQMFPGVAFPSLISDMMATMLNPTLATWEAAPAATVIERTVTAWMARFMGMPEGSHGILLPGGSISNLFALTVARNTRLNGSIASKGLAGVPERGAIFCSDASHYSVANAGDVLGIGRDQVIKIATNQRNEILVDDLLRKLEETRAKGLKPFALVATMGITVTGGFDPLEEIAKICKEQDIHLHVDAAFGGSMSLTDMGPSIFKGIEHADTVIWDAHKWMHVPITCTALMAPNPNIFKQVFSSGADYLFHPQTDDIAITEDLGEYTLMCGKRFDGLVIWFLLQAFGENTFRAMMNGRMDMVCKLVGWFDQLDDLEMSYVPRSPLVCFRYMPKEVAAASGAYQDKLHRWVREQVKQQGKGFFNIARLKGRDHFRMVLINQLATFEEISDMLGTVRALGRAFVADNPPS